MKNELERLQPSVSFSRAISHAAREHSIRNRFWASGTQWLKDGIIADWFATKTNASLVRLIPECRPDFEVRYRNGLSLKFEATIADLPNREMGREAQDRDNSGQTIHDDPAADWVLRRQAIPDALERACNKKVDIPYDGDTCLLIYLNLGTYDCWQSEIECDLIAHTANARSHFRSVWVLWSGRLYRVWPQPFLGNGAVFRPGRHELGHALNRLESKKVLQAVFSKQSQ
jgi:hypothetical protein